MDVTVLKEELFSPRKRAQVTIRIVTTDPPCVRLLKFGWIRSEGQKPYFSVTGVVYDRPNRIPGEACIRHPNGKLLWVGSCGQLCDEEFEGCPPEFLCLRKWHLCSTEGPTHYVANTVHLAGDKDCWGLRKGEFRQFKDKAGLPLWHVPFAKEFLLDTTSSDTKPTQIVVEYEPYGQLGDGKERELDAARRAAIWPDATDEDLTAPGLEQRLLDRLPGLMAQFRKDVEAAGLSWPEVA